VGAMGAGGHGGGGNSMIAGTGEEGFGGIASSSSMTASSAHDFRR
jgi:hypothetical protein